MKKFTLTITVCLISILGLSQNSCRISFANQDPVHEISYLSSSGNYSDLDSLMIRDDTVIAITNLMSMILRDKEMLDILEQMLLTVKPKNIYDRYQYRQYLHRYRQVKYSLPPKVAVFQVRN